MSDIGVLLPDAGRGEMDWGNHELAWNLFNDASSATLEALGDELRDAQGPLAIVTAEDLSLLASRPAALANLAFAIRKAGYEPKVVVYLRAQGFYAESMYGHRFRQDARIGTIAAFIDEVLRSGTFALESGGTVHFDYAKLLAPFSEAFGHNAIVARAYDTSAGAERIFKDFLQTLYAIAPSVPLDRPHLHASHGIANERLRFVQLLGSAWMRIFPDIALPEDPLDFLGTHVPELPESLGLAPFRLFSRDEHLSFLSVFADSNRNIRDEYGVAVPFMSPGDIPPTDDTRWKDALLQRQAFEQCVAAWTRKRDALQRRSE